MYMSLSDDITHRTLTKGACPYQQAYFLLKSVRNWCMGRLFMQSNSPVWLSLYIDVEEIPITQRTEVKIPQAVGRRHTD